MFTSMTDPIDPTPPVGKAARNETRKAIAATANALSITLLVTIWLQPVLSGRPAGLAAPLATLVFVALQGAAHYVLRKVED
ncbi:hypothetical protein PMI01_01600 [Caulobacter sp. AP07]|nr:hypothetical protein PMI01_01600 [Caulobacter sp. AP07]